MRLRNPPGGIPPNPKKEKQYVYEGPPAACEHKWKFFLWKEKIEKRFDGYTFLIFEKDKDVKVQMPIEICEKCSKIRERDDSKWEWDEDKGKWIRSSRLTTFTY